MHQLIREPIGFQAARGNIVDEQLKLHAEWAASGQRTTSPLVTDRRRVRCVGSSTPFVQQRA